MHAQWLQQKVMVFIHPSHPSPPPPRSLEGDEESVKMVSEALNHTNQISLKPGNSIAAECMGGRGVLKGQYHNHWDFLTSGLRIVHNAESELFASMLAKEHKFTNFLRKTTRLCMLLKLYGPCPPSSLNSLLIYF